MNRAGMPQVALAIGAIFLLLIAAFFSLRFGYADVLSARETVMAREAAVSLAPANARYHLLLADARDAAGGDPGAALLEAAELNPHNVAPWIQLGLRAEREGRFDEAERHLRHAVSLSRTYRPRWVLADFYFRRQQLDEFWAAGHTALATGFPDTLPLFRMMWLADRTGEEILARGIPDDHDVLVNYLRFLMMEKGILPAEPVAVRLLSHLRPGDDTLLLQACDGLLTAGRLESALTIWNTLSQRRLIPHAALDPAAGRSLTNGHFDTPPISKGFDWRLANDPNLRVSRGDRRVTVDFTGRQSDEAIPLQQWVPLQPATRYRLSIDANADDLHAGSGLQWRVVDAANGSDLLTAPDAVAREGEPAVREFAFESGPATTLARLTLDYKRRPGMRTLRGTLRLDAVRLERVP